MYSVLLDRLLQQLSELINNDTTIRTQQRRVVPALHYEIGKLRRNHVWASVQKRPLSLQCSLCRISRPLHLVERSAIGEHFVQYNGKRIYISRKRILEPPSDFWCPPARIPGWTKLKSVRWTITAPVKLNRKPKINYFAHTIWLEQDIFRRQVPVNDMLSMQKAQPIGNASSNLQLVHNAKGNVLFMQQRGERAPFHILKGHKARILFLVEKSEAPTSLIILGWLNFIKECKYSTSRLRDKNGG